MKKLLRNSIFSGLAMVALASCSMNKPLVDIAPSPETINNQYALASSFRAVEAPMYLVYEQNVNDRSKNYKKPLQTLVATVADNNLRLYNVVDYDNRNDKVIYNRNLASGSGSRVDSQELQDATTALNLVFDVSYNNTRVQQLRFGQLVKNATKVGFDTIYPVIQSGDFKLDKSFSRFSIATDAAQRIKYVEFVPRGTQLVSRLYFLGTGPVLNLK